MFIGGSGLLRGDGLDAQHGVGGPVQRGEKCAMNVEKAFPGELGRSASGNRNLEVQTN